MSDLDGKKNSDHKRFRERPLLCSFGSSIMAFMYMPGATAVGITYDGGIVLASERRISYGNFVVSKNTKKTFKITDFVGACCAGMVADMQVLAMQMRALTKIRKLELKREIPPNSVAKMMSSLMYERRFYPLLTQVIVGGVNGDAAIYTLDPLGSVLPDDYADCRYRCRDGTGSIKSGVQKRNEGKGRSNTCSKINQICYNARCGKRRWY